MWSGVLVTLKRIKVSQEDHTESRVFQSLTLGSYSQAAENALCLHTYDIRPVCLLVRLSLAHLPDSLDGVVEGVAHCGAPPVGGRGPVVDVGTEDGLTTQ